MKKRFKIGLSSCFFHADPQRAIFKGKTLMYMEQSLANWVMSEDVLAYLVPAPGGKISLPELVEEMDGIVLQGGSDVAPGSYGEKAIKPEWGGDAVRDAYEIALVKECLARKKPLLGICRGAQLLNVALGGTLYQDITHQVPHSRVHRNWEVYDQIFHNVRIEAGGGLAKLYPGKTSVKVNTVHHQAVKDLAKELKVEATSEEDGIVEAARYTGGSFALAVQWHPEFQDPSDASLLDGKPILREFLEEVRRHRA